MNLVRRELVTDATVKPVTLGDLKKHMRIDGSEHDVLLNSYIAGATDAMQKWTGRQFINATFRLYFNNLARNIIELPGGKLQSVTSIQHYNDAGTLQTVTASLYNADTISEPGRIVLAYNQSWPSVRGHENDVRVNYVAGYGATADYVPDMLKVGVMMLAAHWFEHSESVTEMRLDETPMGIQSVVALYKLPWSDSL